MMIHDIILCELPFGKVKYARPSVVVHIKNDATVSVLPISTKTYGSVRFEISIDHPDFSATGLSETSFIYGERAASISPSLILKTLGSLRGKLKDDFIRWYG